MILLYAGSASGKSHIAEDMAANIAKRRGTGLIYIATMEANSDAAKARIKKHKAAREGKGFYTNGKNTNTYFISSESKSTVGVFIFEYVEKHAISDLINFI